MKFDYQFEQKDFSNYLKETNNKYNYICLALFTIVYFGACLDLLSTNAISVLIYYVICLIILFSILKILTLFFVKGIIARNNKVMGLAYGKYKVEITDQMIIEDIHDQHFELKYEDIYRISKNDKWMVLYPKNEKIMFLFLRKSFTKEATYEKCVNMILRNYNRVQQKQVKDHREEG